MSDTIAKLRELLLSQSRAGRLRGLLDSIYGAASTGAEAYGAANSPMAPEHAAGLLGTIADLTPVVGDVKSAYEGVQAAREGDWTGAGLGMLGALPFVPNMANIFVGKGSKTWDAISASKAMDMEKDGIDPRIIWKETGSWKGPDGHWRQEISDDTARFRFDFESTPQYKNTYLNKQVDVPVGGILNHQKLYSAYPDILRNVRINEIQKLPSWMPDSVTSGSYRESYHNRNPAKIDIRAKSEDDAIGMMLHELQHDIQQARERVWAKGGNESNSKSFDAYRHLAGEAEARATQARMKLNAKQRRNLFPEDSYDVPISELIFKK